MCVDVCAAMVRNSKKLEKCHLGLSTSFALSTSQGRVDGRRVKLKPFCCLFLTITLIGGPWFDITLVSLL